MVNLTALLIVLMLTGSPVANAICVNWCPSRPTMAGTCEGNIAEPTSATMSNGSDTCAVLLAVRPFVKEEGRVTFHASAPIGVMHTLATIAPSESYAAYFRSECEGIDARPGAARVLRL